MGFIHLCRQSGVVLHSSYSCVANELKCTGGEGKLLFLSEDSSGAAALPLGKHGKGRQAQTLAEFMKKAPRNIGEMSLKPNR